MVTQLSGCEQGGQHPDSGSSAHLQNVPSRPLGITRTQCSKEFQSVTDTTQLVNRRFMLLLDVDLPDSRSVHCLSHPVHGIL